MKLTMKEIAKLANVSQSTVSRVINGNKAVNDEAAQRVWKVIEEVGFIPNKAAQTLKRSRSNIIGVSIYETYNPYFIELMEHLEYQARQLGYSILLHNSNRNPITEWENIQNFIARQVDGIIIVPTGDYNLERIRKLPIPAAIITQNKKQLDSVGLDHILSGKMVAESFIHAGHKTFAYIGTSNRDDKLLGFQSAINENGFTFNPENYIHIEESSTSSFLMRRDIEAYLHRNMNKVGFTSVLTSNDIMAIEFMKAATERNIKVPEDIVVVGFDDTYLSKIMGISSVHQPLEEMVRMTFELLINRIENEITSEPVQLKLKPTLIERNSTGGRSQ